MIGPPFSRCALSLSLSLLLHNPIKCFPLDISARHSTPHIPLKPIPIAHQIIRGLFVQRIASIRLEEQELQPHNHRIQIEHRFPIFSENVQTDIAFEVDVGVVDLLFAFDFGRFVREVLADDEGEVEDSAFVESFVGCESEGEVEDVVGVGEVRFHGGAEGEFREIWKETKLVW